MKQEALKTLENAGYRILGKEGHSAVKVCHWAKKSLLGEGVCYKEKFYGNELGVRSHLCLQLTPSLKLCDHRCVYCWRDIENTASGWEDGVDSPEEILDSALTAQRILLSGFGGNPDVDKQKFKEAQKPRHCAISLSGEPTLYPKINELIEACKSRGMSSFLVTNGLHPEVLENLVPPTQLYLSLVAPDPKTYNEVCMPLRQNGWDKLNKSLEVLSGLGGRRVVRLTLVKDMNLKNPAGYAKMIERANPDFVEAKAYMYVGYSRKRLKMENMPLHQEISEFAKELEKYCGYGVVDESEPSRVVLLKR